MIELRGNIWDLAGPNDIICITTNGFVKRDGSSVMGKGIALEAKRKFPGIDRLLGALIQQHGNIVQPIIGANYSSHAIYSFPVKPTYKICTDSNDYVSHMRFNVDDVIPGWACKASYTIIESSCRQLVRLLENDTRDVYIGRPGAGAGELPWVDVKFIIEPILNNDKFKICTF